MAPGACEVTATMLQLLQRFLAWRPRLFCLLTTLPALAIGFLTHVRHRVHQPPSKLSRRFR